MNHCFMNFSVLGSKPALQVFNQKRPDPIDTEQVDRKENNCYQSNDRRVLNFVRGRPRNSPHFRARVAQELRGALDKSGARSCQSALAPDSPALCPLAKCGRSGTSRADWFFHRSIACCGRLAEATHFVFVFVLQPANFFPALLAGVPGFEPGLSVLETDVLTVDTIPLLTLPIADFRLLIARHRKPNWKSAIGNVTSFPYGPCAYGSAGRTYLTPDGPSWSSCSWL